MIDLLKFFSQKNHADHKNLPSEERLRCATSKVQRLVDSKFAEIDGEPSADSPLSQVNLLEGDKVVYDYLVHGESGLALDHLRYMIDETCIELPLDLSKEIQEIAALFGVIKYNASENKIKIVFERDSVCAGDDAFAPNPQDFAFNDPPALSEVLNLEVVKNYLPCVFQSKTYWIVICNDQEIAKIEHSCMNERHATIELLSSDVIMNTNKIFFRYKNQSPL